MIKRLKSFLRREEGAITVDWIVLTAAVCALATVSYIAAKDSSDTLADQTQTYLSDRQPGE